MAGWLLGLFHCWVVSRNGTQGGHVCEVKPFDGCLVMPGMKEVLVTFTLWRQHPFIDTTSLMLVSPQQRGQRLSGP